MITTGNLGCLSGPSAPRSVGSHSYTPKDTGLLEALLGFSARQSRLKPAHAPSESRDAERWPHSSASLSCEILAPSVSAAWAAL